MNQQNRITFDQPLEFRVTRPMACPYLDKAMEQRLAADIASVPNQHDTLAKAGSGGLKTGFISRFAKAVMPACRSVFPRGMVNWGNYKSAEINGG